MSLLSDRPEKPLLGVLRGHVAERPPVWLMRQAGRYLPEYRALRAEKGGFLDLVYDSDAAAEVTIQPLRRFGFDGAILFSDILVVPHIMGQKLWFEEGEGPRLAPPLLDGDLGALDETGGSADSVFATVRQVKAALDTSVTMLGFAGSPWTVATYMVAGQGTKDQSAARRLAYRDPKAFARLIEAVVETTVDYVSGQIVAGADAIQLFDSWAGSLSPEQFRDWVIAPNAAIVKAVKARHPDTPVIGFPKGAGAKLVDYAAGTGVDALGLDETIDIDWAAREFPKDLPLQGNLDPLALLAGGDALARATDKILGAMAGRPHIFNLGHGILQDTPIDHVHELLERVRG